MNDPQFCSRNCDALNSARADRPLAEEYHTGIGHAPSSKMAANSFACVGRNPSTECKRHLTCADGSAGVTRGESTLASPLTNRYSAQILTPRLCVQSVERERNERTRASERARARARESVCSSVQLDGDAPLKSECSPSVCVRARNSRVERESATNESRVRVGDDGCFVTTTQRNKYAADERAALLVGPVRWPLPREYPRVDTVELLRQ